MHNYVGIFQYWGIWHSPVVYGFSPINAFDRSIVVVALSWLLVAGLTAAVVVGIKAMMDAGRFFFELFAGCWVIFLLLMWVIVTDTYYLYKYLYITQFVVITLAMVGMARLLGHGRGWRLAVGGFVITVLAMNLGNNAFSLYDLTQRHYNASIESYRQLRDIDPDRWAETYVDISRFDHADVVKRILEQSITTARDETRAAFMFKGKPTSENVPLSKTRRTLFGRQLDPTRGIIPSSKKTTARFLLHKKDAPDVTIEPLGELVWENDLFELRHAPAQNLLHLTALWEPETNLAVNGKMPFRWIGERRIGLWLVEVARLSAEIDYLYVCAESGPSNDFGEVEISLSDNQKRKISQFTVANRKCNFFPVREIADDPFMLRFQNETVGHNASMVDPRKLHIRLLQIGLTAGRYNWDMIKWLNAESAVSKSDGAFFGHGWYPLENFGGEQFRWMPGRAEILIYAEHGGAGVLRLEIEAGPDRLSADAGLWLNGPTGQRIGEQNFKGPQYVEFSVNGLKKGFNTLTVGIETNDRPSTPDPRILAARVMSLEWRSTN